jgi:hypothetical protein
VRNGGITLVWGPPRSGTTWMYNVVREIMRVSELDHDGWVHGQQPPQAAPESALVIKAHQAHSLDVIDSLEMLDHVYLVGMFRDPERAFQSLVRTQTASREELLGWLDHDIRSIEEALPRIPGAVVCREEWIESHAAEVIARLCDWVGVALSEGERLAIVEMYAREQVRSTVSQLAQSHGWSDDFRNYDTESHWHANHIAPPTHRPVELSDSERSVLDALRLRVEYVTGTHSLLATVPARRRPPEQRTVSQEFLNAVSSPQRRPRLLRPLGALKSLAR